MADWYVSSAAYAAIAAFVPSAVYTVGNIVKPTAPALKARYAFRCTTAGTASTEPAWPSANNSTITTGGATFTNVTGQSTYFWGAAAGDLPSITAARLAANDRVFISSDHAETQTSATTYSSASPAGFGVNQFLCVNRAGSTPPVAADLTTGATCTVSTGILTIDSLCETYHYGISYVCSSGSNININSSGFLTTYLNACQLYLNSATGSARIINNSPATLVLDNSTLRFGSTAQYVTNNSFYRHEVIWLNTASAIAGATIPVQLFQASGGGCLLVTARGVDLSAITGTLAKNAAGGSKYLFDSCKVASGVTRYDITGVTVPADELELVNCYNGSIFVNERYQPAGAVTTETTITLAGGAADNVGAFSHKMVSNTNLDKYAAPLTSFWMDVDYATTGSSKTATVEIISSASLNNDEISLLLEYQGTAGSSVATIVTTLPATVLTTAAAVTTSTATWNSSPSTPQKQKLQVTFTPQTAGRVRGQVRLGKAGTTVYINPQVTIT